MCLVFVEFQVLEKEAFQKQMLEKLIWISAFMLVGARHQGVTVGTVEKEHRSEVSRNLFLQLLSLVPQRSSPFFFFSMGASVTLP